MSVRTLLDLPAVAPYADLPVPDGAACVALDVPVGRLTAYVAAPDGAVRGTALLVPGYTGSKEDFARVVPLLRDAGWAVVAYSRRGQPDSVSPTDADAYLLDQEVRDVLDVAALVRQTTGTDRLHLLGHSYGGIITRAALLADPAPFASWTAFSSGPRGWGTGMLEQWFGPGVHTLDGLLALPPEPAGTAADELPAALEIPADPRTPLERFEARRLADADPLVRRVGAWVLATEPDRTAQVAAAVGQAGEGRRIPVHVVHGDADDAWPVAWQRDMAERLGARYTVIPGAGHSAQLDRPRETAAAWSAFWADADARAGGDR